MVVRRLLPIAPLALAVASCVDAPFARVNPNDPAVEFSMVLVSSRDTITMAEPSVVFQIITDPVMVGYTPLWTSNHGGLSNLGGGSFQLVTPSASVQPITVTASFIGRTASRVIYRAPSP